MEIQQRVKYGSNETMIFCQLAAARIRTRKVNVITDLVIIGRELIKVKERLEHGQFQPWVEQEADMSVGMAWKCRRLAEDWSRFPVLRQFESIEAALKFPTLDAELQREIVAKEAFTWLRFNEVEGEWRRRKWHEGMEARMAGTDGVKIPYEQRMGEALDYVRDAMGSDDVVIAEEATAFYRKHRDEFARLSDSPPSVVDADVGWREPRDDTGQWGYVDDCCELWACVKRPDGGWESVAQLRKVVTLWPDPRPAMYLTRDGPATEAWQASAMDLLLERRRIRERVGEVL